MICKKWLSHLTITVLLIGSQAAYAVDSVDNAFKFCTALDGTGLLSKPCEVSGWSLSIDISIDTTSNEARKICSGIASQGGGRFDRGWKLKIYSPYSNGNTLAQCDLS